MSKKTSINCEWRNTKKVVVNPDGQVWPCCYFCNYGYKTEALGVYGPNNQVEDLDQPGETWVGRKNGDDVFVQYKKHYKELNLKHNSMEDILNHEWYTKILPESWEKEETRVEQCRRFCEVEHDE
jgi:hypothetical protein